MLLSHRIRSIAGVPDTTAPSARSLVTPLCPATMDPEPISL